MRIINYKFCVYAECSFQSVTESFLLSSLMLLECQSDRRVVGPFQFASDPCCSMQGQNPCRLLTQRSEQTFSFQETDLISQATT